MKKAIIILLAVLVEIALFTGCSEQNTNSKSTDAPQQSAEATPDPGSSMEPENLIPADLLGEMYNPFFDVEFPDDYTAYEAEYVKEDKLSLYYLYLTVEDPAEDVVTFISNLLGDSAEESIAQNLSALEDEGMVHIHGTDADAGLNADCKISPTQLDSNYEYVDGYEVQLVISVQPDEAYTIFIESNINPDALSGVSDDIDFSSAEYADIRVNTQKIFTQISYGYHIDNAANIRDSMISGFAEDYHEDIDQIGFVYGGELFININFDLENNIIYISQMINQTNISLKDYSPATTLQNFGFEDFRDTNAKCTFKDDENGIFIAINRSEWGVDPNESENNAITFIKNFDDDSLVVFYYPETNVHLIMINYEGLQVKYEYYETDDRYVDEHGGDDLESAKEIAEAIFNKPDTDSILQDGWVTFEKYINETFEINKNDLYELSYD